VASATDDDGNALPAGKYCFTVDRGTSAKEYLIGQLNGTSVTSVYSVSRQGVETSGAARAHRIGASVILTDFATIQRVADILRGQVDLDGSSPVGYDAEPTLADRKDLATVGYVLDTVSGGTVAYDSQIISSATGGENIVAGNLVYFKTSDQEWYLTDADTAATVDGVQLGIALGTGSNGVAITGGVQISGTYTTTGLTAGALYYASNTGGAISSSAGTTSRVVGLALSTTKLLLIPVNPQSLTKTNFDFLAGATGLVLPFAGSVAPTGFLLCYGQAVSRTTYAALFSVISTTYGVGDGSSTFNVPDLRGRIIAGLDNLGGSSANRITDTGADSLAGTFGAETHTLTTAEMPSHTHDIMNGSTGNSGSGYIIVDAIENNNTSGTLYAAALATGGGGAHNNVQPTLFMSYIIKT
jgi:microcystin-dependent protein